MKCRGRNLDDHCCWLNGSACQFLEENSQPGFRWTCGLLRELGNWDAVLADERYQSVVRPVWDGVAARTGAELINCRDFPTEPCNQCGAGLNG